MAPAVGPMRTKRAGPTESVGPSVGARLPAIYLADAIGVAREEVSASSRKGNRRTYIWGALKGANDDDDDGPDPVTGRGRV